MYNIIYNKYSGLLVHVHINLQFFYISEQLKDVFRYNIVRNLFNLPAVVKEMANAGSTNYKQLASVRSITR